MSSTAAPDAPSMRYARDPYAITDASDFLDSMVAEGKGWVDQERAYLTLMMTTRAAELSKSLVGAFVWLILVGAIMAFLGVAAAIGIGKAIGDPAVGYLIVAGIYAVLLGAFALLWKGAMGDGFKLRIINLLHGH